MNKNKLSRFLLSASAGMFSTVGVSEIKAATIVEAADQVSTNQAAVRTQHKATIANHLVQNEGMTQADATAAAADVMSNASAFTAIEGQGASVTQLATFLKDPLKAGVFDSSHLDDYLAEYADRATMQELDVNDVRDYASPAVERLVAPDQVSTMDQALYFANQRKVGGDFKQAAEFFKKASDFATDNALKTEYSENALMMYSEYFIHNVARVNGLTQATVDEAKALLDGAVTTLANATDTITAYKRAIMCAKELGTATHELALKEKAAITAAAAADKNTKRASTADLFKKLYAADMVANGFYLKAVGKSEGTDKNAMMVEAANQKRLGIAALADAEGFSKDIVANVGTQLLFEGDVTIATKLAEVTKAFVGEYADIVDGAIGNKAEQLAASAAKVQIEGSKLKATWNARRQYDAASATYGELNTQYDNLKTAINTALTTANTQYTNLATGEEYIGAADIAAIRRVHAEVLYRDTLTAVAGDGTAVAAAMGALVAYVDGAQTTVANDMADALNAAVKPERIKSISAARSATRETLASAQARVATAYAKEVAARAGAVIANDSTNMEAFLKYAGMSNAKAFWEAGILAADAMLADATISAAATDADRLANVLARAVKAQGHLRLNTAADDAAVAAVDAAGALTSGVLFDGQAVAAAITANSAEAERAYKALTTAFESGAELINDIAVKQGVRTQWADVEDRYATALRTLADATMGVRQSGDGDFVTEIYAQIAAAGNTTAADVINDLDTYVGAAAYGAATAAVTGAGGAAAAIDANTYLETTINGVRYVSKPMTVAAAAQDYEFEAVAVGGPVGGPTVFTVNATAAGATVAQAQAVVELAIQALTPADFAGTLAAYYNGLTAGEKVALGGIEGIYSNLMAKFDEMRADSTHAYASKLYGRYTNAAKAWENARKAKADWAAQKVADLGGIVSSTTWQAERNAAAASYTAAAGFETNRMGAMIAARGQGVYNANVDTLANILANVTGNGATQYANEDVMKALYALGMQNKMAAKTSAMTRDATTTEPAVPAAAGVDASVNAAVVDGGEGAYELMLNFVNQALQGLTAIDPTGSSGSKGTMVAERLASVASAFRHVNNLWMSDLTSTIGMLSTANLQDAMKDTLHGLIQANNAAVGATNDLTGRLFSLDQLFSDVLPVPVNNHGATQAYYRAAARANEDMLKIVDKLGVAATAANVATDAQLDTNKGHLWDVLDGLQGRVATAALTAFIPAGDVLAVGDRDDILSRLTEYANRAATAASAAYAGTMSVMASNTADVHKTQRSVNINAAIRDITLESSKDMTKQLTSNQDTTVVTADHKAQAYHQMGRLMTNYGKANSMRFLNDSSAEHKAAALKAYEEAISAYSNEIEASLSLDFTQITNHNARLIDAYENLAEAYKYAVQYGGKADWKTEQYMATFHQAKYMYRGGDVEGSFRMLDGLVNNKEAKKLVGGHLMAEIAAQYEAEGRYVKAAAVYKAGTEVHVGNDNDAKAFDSADAAMKDAKITGEPLAAKHAAAAYNMIGAKTKFDGRVRAEAHHNGADAQMLAKNFVEAGKAYMSSAEVWASIGDHMQAGNMYEKAAWALRKLDDAMITLDQRIVMLGYLAKSAKQLQIAGSLDRIEKLAKLADTQFQSVSGNAGVLASQLSDAVVEFAKTLVEEAMAFQREGKVAKAVAAEAKIRSVLDKVDTKDKEAVIHAKVGDLLMLQKKYAEAVDSYETSAKNFDSAKMHAEAINSYRLMADAALKGKQGTRIRDGILPAVLKIRDDKKAEAGADPADVLKVQMNVLSVYADMMALLPHKVDEALTVMADVETALATSTDNVMKAQFAVTKISLLDRKARRENAENKAQHLLAAKAEFDKVKDMTGATDKETVSVYAYVAKAGGELSAMYRRTNAFRGDDSVAKIEEVKKILESTVKASKDSYNSAVKAKTGFDMALTASEYAAKSVQAITRTMMHYMHQQKDKARAEDMVYFKSLPGQLVDIAGVAVKAYLRGLLQTTEAAKKMQHEFVAVINAAHKANRWVLHYRKNSASADKHGDATKAAASRKKVEAAKVTLDASLAVHKDKVAAAHAEKKPVARSEATKKVVSDQAEATAKAVTEVLAASADLATSAPAESVDETKDLAATKTALDHIVGTADQTGAAQKLRDVASGPSARASTITPEKRS